MGRDLPLPGMNWGLTDGWPAGGRGSTLPQEQGESHTFRGYCFLYNHLPRHGEPVLPKLCSLYKHLLAPWFTKISETHYCRQPGGSGVLLWASFANREVHLSDCALFFFYIGYWWLLWKRRSFWNAAKCQVSLGTFKTENRWNQNGGTHKQLSLQSM